MVAKLSRKDTVVLDQPTEEIIQLSAADIGNNKEQYVEVQSGKPKLVVGKGIRGAFTSLPFLLTGMVVSFIAVAWLFGTDARQADRESKYVEQSSQLLMLSQRLAKDAREAVLGQEGAFKTLKESRDTFEGIINGLTKGNAKLDMPPTPRAVTPALESLTKTWVAVRGNVDQILGQEQPMLTMRDHVVAINQMSPLLLATWDEIVEEGIKSGIKSDQLYLAGRQSMLSQRIAKDVNLFSQGGSDAAVAAAQFGKDSKLFVDTQNRLRANVPPAIRSRLEEASTW